MSFNLRIKIFNSKISLFVIFIETRDLGPNSQHAFFFVTYKLDQ